MGQQLRYIPQNILKSGRILGFRKRNLLEGVIWAALDGLVLNMIPFTPKVKLVVIICVCLVVLAINAIGIMGLPFSEIVIYYIRYKYYRSQFSYRRFNKNVEQRKPVINENGKVRTVQEARTTEGFKKIIGI